MPDTRLIERWLPIAALGVESVRERTPMTPFPAPNRLHVWWARRPLVASRAAVLASLLPADADRDKFMRVLGIHGDPVATRRRIDSVAKRNNQYLGPDPYGYKRAFSYVPDREDKKWVDLANGCSIDTLSILDPTAGGGCIPFEAGRVGLTAIANDLNQVAALILRATVEWPGRFGSALLEEFGQLTRDFVRRAEPKYERVFPLEPEGVRIEGYLWARTITCPYCDGLCAAIAQLASRARRNRCQAQASPCFPAPGRRAVSVRSRSSNPPGNSRMARWRVVQAPAPIPIAARSSTAMRSRPRPRPATWASNSTTVVYKKRVVKTLKSGKRGKDKWVRGLPGAASRGRQQRRDSGRGLPRSCPSGKRWTSCRASGSPR